MNTGFDFKVGKSCGAAIQWGGGREGNLQPLRISCCTKEMFTCLARPVGICLLNVQPHSEFFNWARMCRRNLCTADSVMAQRCSNNYVNNFHFKINTHTHTHTHTRIYIHVLRNTCQQRHNGASASWEEKHPHASREVRQESVYF